MCIHMYIYIYIHIYVCVYIYIYIYIHTHLCNVHISRGVNFKVVLFEIQGFAFELIVGELTVQFPYKLCQWFLFLLFVCLAVVS